MVVVSSGRIVSEVRFGTEEFASRNPPGLQHGLHVRHRQRLLEHVVVNEHVRGNHEIERLAIEAIGHDVHVQHRTIGTMKDVPVN